MAIHKVRASNFKSFNELEVELRPLNILVGANAAGKSNFLEIFRFLRDLSELGIENAVQVQGGMDYLANVKIGSSRPVILQPWVGGDKWCVTLERKLEAPGFTADWVRSGPRTYDPQNRRCPPFPSSKRHSSISTQSSRNGQYP